MDPNRPTILSPEGSAEAPDTPEQRAMLKRVRREAEVRERWAEISQGLHDPDEPLILSEEGSREVIDEIVNGSPMTPERAATFELMRQMAGVRKRRPGSIRQIEKGS